MASKKVRSPYKRHLQDIKVPVPQPIMQTRRQKSSECRVVGEEEPQEQVIDQMLHNSNLNEGTSVPLPVQVPINDQLHHNSNVNNCASTSISHVQVPVPGCPLNVELINQEPAVGKIEESCIKENKPKRKCFVKRHRSSKSLSLPDSWTESSDSDESYYSSGQYKADMTTYRRMTIERQRMKRDLERAKEICFANTKQSPVRRKSNRRNKTGNNIRDVCKGNNADVQCTSTESKSAFVALPETSEDKNFSEDPTPILNQVHNFESYITPIGKIRVPPNLDPKAVYEFGSRKLTGEELRQCRHSGAIASLAVDLFMKLFTAEEMAVSTHNRKPSSRHKNTIHEGELDETRINAIIDYVKKYLEDEFRPDFIIEEVKSAIASKVHSVGKTSEVKDMNGSLQESQLNAGNPV